MKLARRLVNRTGLARRTSLYINRWAENNTEDRDCVNILTFNDNDMYRFIMDAKDMDDLTEYSFEGQNFLGIRDHDRYLRAWYEDYMEFPPEDERVSHHVTEVFWKE